MSDRPRWMARLGLGIGVVAAVLVVGGVLALRAVLTPERLRSETARVTAEATGLDTQLDSAELSFWPLAVQIRGLRIAGDDPAGPPLLTLDGAQLRMSLRPLLARQVVIERIEIDQPVLALRKDGAAVVLPGKLGAPASSPRRRDAGAPGAATAPLGAVSSHFRGVIERLEIRDGSLRLRTPGGVEDVDVDGLHLAVRLELSEGAREFGASGALQLRDLSLAALTAYRRTLDSLHPTVDFDVSYRPREGRLQIRALNLRADPLVLAVGGEITGLPTEPRIDLTLEPHTYSLEELLPLVPPDAFPEGRAPIAEGPVTVSAHVRGALGDPAAPPEARAEIRFEGARLALSGADVSVGDVRGTVAATATSLELRDLSLALGSDTLTLRGRIDGTDRPGAAEFDLQVNGRADLGVVHRAGFLPEGTVLSGSLDLNAGARGSAAEREAILLSGRAELSDVAYSTPELPVPVTDVNARVELSGTVVLVSSVSGRVGTSEFEGSGRVERALSPEPRVNLEGRTHRLDLREWTPGTGDGAEGRASPAPDGAPPPLLPPLPPVRADLRLAADSVYTTDAVLAGASLTIAMAAGRAHVDGKATSGDFGKGVHMDALFAGVDVVGQTMDGTFRSSRVNVHGVPLTDVNGRLRLGEDRRLAVSDATAAVWTGRVEGAAVVDLAVPAKPAFEIETRATGLQANDFVSGLTPAHDFLFGTLDITSTFSGHGATPEAVAASLVGNGQVNTKEGRLNRGPQTRAVWSALQLGDRDAIPFRDMVTAFSVRDGHLVTDNLVLIGQDASWNARGAVGFDGTLDYQVEVELSDALSDRFRKSVGQDLATLLQGTSGKIVLDLAIDGRVQQPRVSLDRKRLAERARENAARNLKEELQRGKEKLGDALRGLLGGK